MNTNATIMSVVAQYLSSVEFRNKISVDTEEALRTCTLDVDAHRQFSKFDFQALASFGGLITKTQHNFLYECLPYTRQLLRMYQLDLTIFAGYRTEIQSTSAAVTSRLEKATRFIGYLRLWLHGRDDAFPGLEDLLEHEYILWNLKSEPASDVTESSVMRADAAKRRRAVPTIRPAVKLAEFRYNPFRIIDHLEQGTPPQRSQRRRSRLVYWIDTQQSQVRVAEPGRTVWKVLRLCDGRRRVPSLCKELAPLPPAAVRGALALAQASGLIIMEKPR